MSFNVPLIKESFERAKPIADAIVSKFYEFLFSDFPEAKTLFNHVNMDRQKQALIKSLVYIVDNLEQGERLQTYLRAMGARHEGYNVKDEHYTWVGQSLLKSFSYFFKGSWTVELERQWIMAYNFIAEQMMEGAKEFRAIPKAQPIKTAPKPDKAATSVSKVNFELPKELKGQLRSMVREAFMEALQKEIDDIIRDEMKNLISNVDLTKMLKKAL